jgi:hypothetical protein
MAHPLAIIAALRSTDGVTRVSRRKGWIAVNVVSASRAVGLAECLTEAGFKVLSRDRVIVFC